MFDDVVFADDDLMTSPIMTTAMTTYKLVHTFISVIIHVSTLKQIVRFIEYTTEPIKLRQSWDLKEIGLNCWWSHYSVEMQSKTGKYGL